MQIIVYCPENVWDCFQKEKQSLLAKERLIAENNVTGVCIYVGATFKSERLMPEIIVCIDEDVVYSELVTSSFDCESTVQRLYDCYLDDDVEIDHMYSETADEIDREIEERERELIVATADYLNALADANIDVLFGAQEADEVCDDFLNDVCEYIYDKWGISVRRPMYVKDENGNEYLEEFPYECA